MKGQGKSTLLLNASYEPLSVVSAQRAVTLIIQGKAVSLDDSPASFGSATTSINVPYVAKLNKFVHKSKRLKPPKFSRRGVLVRDNNTCVYCGEFADTIDHVMPRAKGGLSTYENCVAACRRCNSKKTDKTLKELGWALNMNPSVPSLYENLLNKSRSNEQIFASWSEYIFMYDPNLKTSANASF
jgi:5-methylcytosine-specific restriction endonuclease McrA